MKIQEQEPVSESLIACPKCGWDQETSPECLRCGVVFAKYKAPEDSPAALVPPSLSQRTKRPRGRSRSLLWLLPLVSLAVTAGLLFLILKQAPPLPVHIDPQAAERVAEKMTQLQLAIASGRPHSLSLTEVELNQWMTDNLAIAGAHQISEVERSFSSDHMADIQQVRSALKDVRINLDGYQLHAYALFTVYGRDISLQLDGALETADGLIRLKPIAGKLGSMPIPRSTLDHVVKQLFDTPQNREQFRLPPQIASVWIENSTLVIVTR